MLGDILADTNGYFLLNSRSSPTLKDDFLSSIIVALLIKFLSISLMTESDIVYGRGSGGRPALIYYYHIFYVSESIVRDEVMVLEITAFLLTGKKTKWEIFSV